MVVPTHLSCWLCPAPAEQDDEETLCDADFTGFTTLPEITFLEAFIQSSDQTMADSDRNKSLNLGLLQFLSLTVQWYCNGKTLKTAQGGATPTLLQTYRFQCLWSHIRDPTDVQMAGSEPGAARWGNQAGTEPRHSLRRCAKQDSPNV